MGFEMVKFREIFEADVIDFAKRKKRQGMSDQEKYDQALKTQKGEPEDSKYTWDPMDSDDPTFLDDLNSTEEFAELVLKIENELPNFEGQMKDGATRFRVLPTGDKTFIVKDTVENEYLDVFSKFDEALLFAYVSETGLSNQFTDIADILLV